MKNWKFLNILWLFARLTKNYWSRKEELRFEHGKITFAFLLLGSFFWGVESNSAGCLFIYFLVLLFTPLLQVHLVISSLNQNMVGPKLGFYSLEDHWPILLRLNFEEIITKTAKLNCQGIKVPRPRYEYDFSIQSYRRVRTMFLILNFWVLWCLCWSNLNIE